MDTTTHLTEFRQLEGYFVGLDDLLERHQDALVMHSFAKAQDLFLRFRNALRRHMADSEGILLPLYEERAKVAPGGAGAPFRAEHMKLERMMASIEARLARLDDPRVPFDARDLVRCIEQEFEMKNLLLAHTLRERSTLLPALDAATEPDEREWLLARCAAQADGAGPETGAEGEPG